LAAAAGVAIPTNASANNAVMGAAENFKSCFILFSLCWFFAPDPTHGMVFAPAPSTPEKSKAILSGARQTIKIRRVPANRSMIIIQ
jgi:hypothetical protein